MKNLITYSEYLFEHANQSKEMEQLVKTLADLSISTIHRSDSTQGEYLRAQELEITEPFLDVDFRLILRKEPSLELLDDPYFSKMKWQHVKLGQNGYVVTGNTFMTDGNIPDVEIVVVLDTDKIDSDGYRKMYHKLINTISHELNHLNQKGWNRDYDNVNPSEKSHRQANGKKHSYFLMPEEIESMVKGMHQQSISQERPIDQLFDEHLLPFVKSGFMTQSEMIEIIRKWLDHTLTYYPNATLTHKYKNIIDNI